MRLSTSVQYSMKSLTLISGGSIRKDEMGRDVYDPSMSGTGLSLIDGDGNLCDSTAHSDVYRLLWHPSQAELRRSMIAQSENEAFRTFEAEPVMDQWGKRKGTVENFIVVNFQKLDLIEATDELLATQILNEGFWLRMDGAQDEHFVPVFFSPAHARTARVMFCKAQMRYEILWQAGYGSGMMLDESKEVVLAKTGARPTMILTGTRKPAIPLPKTMHFPDYTYLKREKVHKVNAPGSQAFTERGPVEMNLEVESKVNAFDGGGLMSPRYAVWISFDENMISGKDAQYLLGKLEEQKLADCMLDPKFARLWPKVINGAQKRCALDKGLDAVEDFNWWHPTLKDVDIIVFDSQRKGNANSHPDRPMDYEAPYLIASYVKPLDEMVFVHYQILQNTSLTGQQLIDLTAWGKERVVEIRKDRNKAMTFWGMISKMKAAEQEMGGPVEEGPHSDDEEAVLEGPTAQVLTARHPMMFTDKYPQDTLTRQVRRFNEDLGHGRIPVKGSYVYMFPDPTAMQSWALLHLSDPKTYDKNWVDVPDENGNYQVNGVLADNEFYLNGMVKTVAGARSPMMRYTAWQRINLVAHQTLALIRNLLVYPVHGGHARWQDGADFDGDKILLSWEQTIIDAIIDTNHVLVVPEEIEPKKAVPTTENLTEYYTSTMAQAPALGTAVNWNTVWIDWALHLGERKLTDLQNLMITAYASLIIDAAKTGFMPEVPKDLTDFVEDKFPHWRGLTPTKKRKPYHSNAPLGKLFDHFFGITEMRNGRPAKVVEGWIDWYENGADETGKKINGGQILKHTVRIMKGMNQFEVLSIIGKVEELREGYGKEMSELALKAKRDEIAGVTRKEKLAKEQECRKGIVERYSDLLHNLTVQHQVDIRSIARAAYFVTYHKAATNVNKPGRNGTGSVGFPWACCPDGMFAILDENLPAEGQALIPVRNIKDMSKLDGVTALEVVDNSNVVAGNKVVGKADAPQGVWPVWSHEDRHYLVVPDTRPVRFDEHQLNKRAQFRLTGFSYLNATADDMLTRLSPGEALTFDWVVEVEGRSYLSVLHNGEKVGEVSQMRQMLDVMLLEGSEVQVGRAQVYSDQVMILDVEVVKEGARVNTGALSHIAPSELVDGLQDVMAKPTYEEIMARVNKQASYWLLEAGQQFTRAQDLSITELSVEWVNRAPQVGGQLCNVYMTHAQAGRFVAQIWVSETRTAAGRPELEVRNFKASDKAIEMILRFADYSHKAVVIEAEKRSAVA